jgi:hypothetical protein
MKSNKYHRYAASGLITSIAMTLAFSMPVAATTSPSDLAWNLVDNVGGEIASVGAAALFLYGLFYVFKAGFSNDSSGAMKRIAISWGIAAVAGSWQVFQQYIRTDLGEGIEETNTAEMAAPILVDQLNTALVAVGYVPF